MSEHANPQSSLNNLASTAHVTSTNIMNYVLLALLPGFCAQVYIFGAGYISNLLLALGSGLITCTVIAWFSTNPAELPNKALNVKAILLDSSNWITCVLITVALPPDLSPWVIFVATSAGLGLGKYAYGGLGQNIFNPAMVGYAVVLISFPAALALWPPLLDGLSSATPLELLKYKSGQTLQELFTSPAFGLFAGKGWQWINAAYLAGGIFLIYKRVITWHIPVSMLGAITILASIWYDMGSSASLGSPLFHFLSGGMMLAVFFIATDPVTCPSSKRGKVYFGLLCGLLIFVIRSWGAYPDGIAFAVLLANVCSPLIDHLLARND